MLVDQAIELTKQLRRYRVDRRGKSVWDQRGTHVAQRIIPQVPKAVDRAVHRLMENGRLSRRIELVDPGKCWSFQKSLRIRSLRWQIRNLAKTQKHEDDLPVMFCYAGHYVVWNGNHRTTAALILGHRRIRAEVYRIRGKR